MYIDRTRAMDAFAAYTAHYDAAQPKVQLKIEHTYRVAALCEEVGRSAGLTGDALDLAWLCGLLHDVGRFEQLRRYGTFNDAESIDHAACSVEVLFSEGHIRDYVQSDAEDALLKTVVGLHSAYRLPETLDPRTRFYAGLLRDADKIDILKVNCDFPLEEIYNCSAGALRTAALTPEVQEDFYAGHAVLRAHKKTPADNVAALVSLVFELEFDESVRIVQKQGYLSCLLDFSTQNPDTAAAFVSMRRHMAAYLARRLGE